MLPIAKQWIYFPSCYVWHVISNNTSYISSLNCYLYFLFSKLISKFEDEQRIRDPWSSKRISFKQSSATKGETGIIIVCFSSFCFTPLARVQADLRMDVDGAPSHRHPPSELHETSSESYAFFAGLVLE